MQIEPLHPRQRPHTRRKLLQTSAPRQIERVQSRQQPHPLRKLLQLVTCLQAQLLELRQFPHPTRKPFCARRSCKPKALNVGQPFRCILQLREVVHLFQGHCLQALHIAQPRRKLFKPHSLRGFWERAEPHREHLSAQLPHLPGHFQQLRIGSQIHRIVPHLQHPLGARNPHPHIAPCAGTSLSLLMAVPAEEMRVHVVVFAIVATPPPSTVPSPQIEAPGTGTFPHFALLKVFIPNVFENRSGLSNQLVALVAKHRLRHLARDVRLGAGGLLVPI
mmetsp:Transcript_66291/g.151906  ORF Transcript_66291/g.151906 Transcript_66291/m.151906 type:complete len:276 (-) Transcript_66291:36-863(-)